MSNVLLVKHLPVVLTDNEKQDLLKYFGAKEVKCISSKYNKHNVAFAKFENEIVAENVLHRLHQVNILDSCLSVEFAKNKNVKFSELNNNLECLTKEDERNEKLYKQFIDKLTCWHIGVDFKQPVPCHLMYEYPPPNSQILTNILKVLMTVPKFYTQVLHLMNKMNLPCPFGKDILPDLNLDIGLPSQREDKTIIEDEIMETENLTESSESEISSDEGIKNLKETIPEQYKIKKKTKIKVPKFVKPTPVVTDKSKSKKTTFEEVFEKVTEEKEVKKIKLSHPIPHIELTKKSDEEPVEKSEANPSGFGYIHPVKKITEEEKPKDIRDEREEERLEKEEIVCISESELAENRISEKDRSVLPVYKNYAEGAPTCRLYIKNLAKAVTVQDLKYIYSRYVPKIIGEEPNMFDIRLMQEGRMKGQAFVTLQNVELAQKALKETNGYILKDKPLVVQFARSAAK